MGGFEERALLVSRDLHQLLELAGGVGVADDQPLHGAQLNKWEHLFSLVSGNLFSDFVLSGILLRLGDYETAANYAADAYAATRPAMFAVHVARAAAALGDNATAAAWLRTAASTAPAGSLQIAIAAAAEFGAMRNDPAYAPALTP